MKRHLNTLFVTTQGAYLAKEGETVVVKVDKEIRLRIPVHTLGGRCSLIREHCQEYFDREACQQQNSFAEVLKGSFRQAE